MKKNKIKNFLPILMNENIWGSSMNGVNIPKNMANTNGECQ